MGNTLSFAEQELNILLASNPDKNDPPIIKEFIPEILAIVEKFGKSGQSGGSAPYVANAITQAIKKLLLQQPICPLTGEPEEWTNVRETVSPGDKMIYQNKRCSALFKEIDGESCYLDAIHWKTQTGTVSSGHARTSTGDCISDYQFIRSFPFTPKTFIIDVIETEVSKDDFVFDIKDENQLIEVFEYYKRK